jgi:FkbM family methyltransferase
LKETIKKILKALPIAFTKNQQYDRLTKRVIKKVCRPDSNGVDIGCHKGEILDLFVASAPNGVYYGFEPIPDLYRKLTEKYHAPQFRMYDYALSNQKGTTSFNYVVSNPSYSGLLKRSYDRPDEKDTLITVNTERLDDVLPSDYRVDILKIDVEGGEMLVLQGAMGTLKRWKPVVIFEHGLGASEMYGATPEQVYDIFESCGMKVSLLDRFLDEKAALSRADFARQYYDRLNYYFIAYA